MNKSKFKAVKFLPFDLDLAYSQRTEQGLCWTNEDTFGNDLINDVYFSDSCIESYPELFEVEKAGREFEEGALYKAKFCDWSKYEVVKFVDGWFYRLGEVSLYEKDQFEEIGEKIEL